MKNIITERLKTYIECKGLGMNEFDRITNTGTNFISRRINKNISFGVDKLIQIYLATDIDGNWLFGSDGPMCRDIKTDIAAEPENIYRRLSTFEKSILESLQKKPIREAIMTIVNNEKDTKTPHTK